MSLKTERYRFTSVIVNGVGGAVTIPDGIHVVLVSTADVSIRIGPDIVQDVGLPEWLRLVESGKVFVVP